MQMEIRFKNVEFLITECCIRDDPCLSSLGTLRTVSKSANNFRTFVYITTRQNITARMKPMLEAASAIFSIADARRGSLVSIVKR